MGLLGWWTRRELHPLPRLLKAGFYYIKYEPESTNEIIANLQKKKNPPNEDLSFSKRGLKPAFLQ